MGRSSNTRKSYRAATLELLKRPHVLETTIRHELVHVVIDTIGGDAAPRWLAEGMALHVAGEGPTLMSQLRKTDTSISDLEQASSRPGSREAMHAAYAAAYREVKRLIAAEGEPTVWRRVKAVLGARNEHQCLRYDAGVSPALPVIG